ncbi:hypothetical protein OKW21_006002 [Catalinimonas alkaloidigena]|uniref:T9SS type A sorting domain-containing protein n=1 Tax=Catalinimonas alkaloidigena TaxID=1075417 RepID=UPI00240531E6|nr:T9SS type A sorting domain-containing protein [Catalinimonas alkaloidigena]MDF9800739.1 hypothetical protein [Catalinimonas alkaloidigena]
MTIGKIAGAGNSTVEQLYQLVDKEPLLGSAYYRLRQTDFDGESTYSKIILLTFYPEAKHYSDLSPNPVAGGKTVLRLGGMQAGTKVRVSLVHMSGKIIRRFEVSANQIGAVEWEMSGLDSLASGVYSVLISTEQFNETLRLIIP